MVEAIKELILKLNRAAKAYYSGVEEILPDKEYDADYDRLVAMEKESGLIFSNSPTQNVGFKVMSELPKVTHEYPSLSLNKTKEVSELIDFLGDNEGIMSWKYDGMTVILTYDGGQLVRAATRGNGEIGEEVTEHAMHFANIPTSIPDTRHIVIRGEAVISHDAFNAMNIVLSSGKRYKNPRSMVAGAIRFLDSEKSAKFEINYLPFDLANAEELGCKTVADELIFLMSLGFTTVDWFPVNADNIAMHIREIQSRGSAGNLYPYPTDGLVVIYDDLTTHVALGATKKYPRYAMALKWPDETKETVLRAIEWSVSKAGLISPIAIFDPVELEGTTVKRASVHNLTVMHELGLGIGDHITVYKANMIIPQIYDCVEKTDNIEIPTVCPNCGGRVETRIGSNMRTEFLYCVDETCTEIIPF